MSTIEQLQSKIESQAREIASKQLTIDGMNEAHWKVVQELAALKAQPSGVVPTQWSKSFTECWPVEQDDLEGDWAVGVVMRDGDEIYCPVITVEAAQYDAPGESEKIARALVTLLNPEREIARLNQPASGGDERAAWTARKPTEEGAYWIRGNGLEADALIQVKHEEGELWCNLHMRNSEPVFEYGYTIEQLSDDFEWLGPLQASAALPVREAVAEGWQLAADALPATGETVLAYYLNSHGMARRIRAMHVKRFTVEAEEFADPDTQCCEYSEQDDCYYTTEGWYELIDNWPDYSSCAVIEGVITHWMQLPAAPSPSREGE